MGFRPKKRTQTVTIPEGSEWYGLSVEMIPMNLETWLGLTAEGAEGLTMRDIIKSVDRMADNVLSWNLEDSDTGVPVATDHDTVLRQDSLMLIEIATRWVESITGVSAPLPTASDNIPSLPEVSLPTETLSLPPESYAAHD